MFNFGKRKKKQQEMPNKSATEVETLMRGIGTQLGAPVHVAVDWADAPKYKAALPSLTYEKCRPGTTMLSTAATEEEATKVADELMERVTEKMIMLQRLKEGRI